MKQSDYIKIAKKKLKNKNARMIMLKQINNYYEVSLSYKQKDNPYKIGDDAYLKKGTLLHGLLVEELPNIQVQLVFGT